MDGEILFSNTPESGTSEPGDDPDLDGMSNLDEFRVGTDPTDPNSRFTITSFDGDRLQWTGRQFDIFGDPGTGANAQWIPNEEAADPGRFEVYELQKSTDLTDPNSWTRVIRGSIPEGVGAEEIEGFIANQDPNEFYRAVRIP